MQRPPPRELANSGETAAPHFGHNTPVWMICLLGFCQKTETEWTTVEGEEASKRHRTLYIILRGSLIGMLAPNCKSPLDANQDVSHSLFG